VIFFLGSERFYKDVHLRLSSFFVETDASGSCRQVHVLEARIGRHKACHLIFYEKKPEAAVVRRMVKGILGRLGLSVNITNRKFYGNIIIANPVQTTRELFSKDGYLNKECTTHLLTPLVKETVSVSTKSRIGPASMQAASTRELDNPSAGFNLQATGHTVVIFCRTSERDSKSKDSGISKQAWLAISNPPEIATIVRSQDDVVVTVEYCSSADWVLRSRAIWERIPSSKPIILLSRTPDRVTRRPDEVQEVIDFVKKTGGEWYTSGLHHDTLGSQTWHLVQDKPTTSLVQQQLEAGKLFSDPREAMANGCTI
jgi:hypothetical protein